MKLRFWRDETKGAEWPLETPPIGDGTWLFPVGVEQAVGLPALIAVLRLLSHATGMVPLTVLRGTANGIDERAVETWQWRLLHRRPGPPPLTNFHFKADLAAQILGRGNVYVRKFGASQPRPGESGRRIVELMPMSAGKVKPKRRNGQVIFEDSTADGSPVSRTVDEITHIRSFALDGGLEGLSPITAARMLFTAGLKRTEFEAKHLVNGIFPGLAFKWPSGVEKQDADAWVEDIEARHKGSQNAGRLIFVGGGAELVPIPISLEDAQFAQATQLTIAQVCAMYQVPLSFFVPSTGGSSGGPTESDWRLLLTFGLGPILAAITDAFTADETLFPPDGDDLFVRADGDALLMLDPKAKAEIHKAQIQTGERLVDELRARDGYGPLPPIPDDWRKEPGKVPQLTPVGGKENPTMSGGNENGGTSE